MGRILGNWLIGGNFSSRWEEATLALTRTLSPAEREISPQTSSSLSRNQAVGSGVFARFFCARTSSFGALAGQASAGEVPRIDVRFAQAVRSTKARRAPHASPCAKICFATTSLPAAWLRLSGRVFLGLWPPQIQKGKRQIGCEKLVALGWETRETADLEAGATFTATD